ncbi:MAG: hypothetical protein ABFR33_02550 [Verrucomicrobiota bacterium]
MRKHIRGIMAIAVGFVVTSWAEDTVPGTASKHGIRIAIRNMPGVDEVEEDDGFTAVTHSADSVDGAQIDVMYVKRFMGRDGNNTVGGFVGGGLFFANSSGEEPGGTVEVELDAYGLIGEGGVAVQLGRVVVLEAGSYLGLGVADQEISDLGSSASDSGAYAVFGLKTAIFFQIGSNIELGLEAGYASFAGMVPDFDASGYDITFSGDGFQGGGVFVVKF